MMPWQPIHCHKRRMKRFTSDGLGAIENSCAAQEQQLPSLRRLEAGDSGAMQLQSERAGSTAWSRVRMLLKYEQGLHWHRWIVMPGCYIQIFGHCGEAVCLNTSRIAPGGALEDHVYQRCETLTWISALAPLACLSSTAGCPLVGLASTNSLLDMLG
jgi:hypothetical protein